MRKAQGGIITLNGGSWVKAALSVYPVASWTVMSNKSCSSTMNLMCQLSRKMEISYTDIPVVESGGIAKDCLEALVLLRTSQLSASNTPV